MEPPAPRRAQVFVVVTEVPHHVGGGFPGDGPMVGHAGDPAQRVVGIVTAGVHLADDRMLGPRHGGKSRQCRADAVAAMVAAYRIQRSRRVGHAQFRCLGEEFDHIGEPAVIHGGGVEVHEITDREPVRHIETHGRRTTGHPANVSPAPNGMAA